MGHESRIEPWSPHLTAFCFAGFGTDRLRRAKVMKTAGRENPNRWGNASSNRAHGAEVQNRSCSIMWAGKQEKVRPLQGCFFLTSPFIELIRHLKLIALFYRLKGDFLCIRCSAMKVNPPKITIVAKRDRHKNSGLAVPRSWNGVATSFPGS